METPKSLVGASEMGCASSDDSKRNGGDAMKTTMFCNKCGAAMTDADEFCASCGTPVAAMSLAFPLAVPPKAAAKPSKFLIGFVIAVAVVAVILLTMFTLDTQTIDWWATAGAIIGKSAVLGIMIWLMNKFIVWRQD